VYYASVTNSVVTYLFHDHSSDGDRDPSILLCKLLAVIRETKLTLSIALNPKSKLTLERGTISTNRVLLERVKVCITDTQNRQYAS